MICKLEALRRAVHACGKGRMLGEAAMLEAILHAGYPKEMKAFGRAVQGFHKEGHR